MGDKMNITPQEIRSQEFGKRFRGYDLDEVKAFLDSLADDLEEIVLENKSLKEKISLLEERLDDYKNMEDTMKQMLLAAQKTSEEKKRIAEREAESLIQDAKLKSERVLQETDRKLSEIKKEILDLKNLKDSYILKIKSILKLQSQLLIRFEKEEGIKHSELREKDEVEEEVGKIASEFRKEDTR
jgi:cell division initiation protein